MRKAEADRLMDGFVRWANEEPSVRALALVGSWSRGAARDDSDLDLLALTVELEKWTRDNDWLRELVVQLGFVPAELMLESHGVARSWRVWLRSDVELEITLADVSWAETHPVEQGTRRVVSDGMQVLTDKDGFLQSIQDAVRAVDF